MENTKLDTVLFNIGIALHKLANCVPKEHELFIKFIREQSALAATVPKDKVKHWAFDLSIMLEGFVAGRIFLSNDGPKNRFERSKKEKETIRIINAYKRLLLSDLYKARKLSENSDTNKLFRANSKFLLRNSVFGSNHKTILSEQQQDLLLKDISIFNISISKKIIQLEPNFVEGKIVSYDLVSEHDTANKGGIKND